METKGINRTMPHMSHFEGRVCEIIWEETQKYGACALSRAEIAARIGCSKSSVALALKEIERRDMIETEHRNEPNGSGLPTLRRSLYHIDEIKESTMIQGFESVEMRWPRHPVR